VPIGCYAHRFVGGLEIDGQSQGRLAIGQSMNWIVSLNNEITHRDI
jgi:hypothetical protein